MYYIILLPILLLSISIHELAHGFTAFLFGDNTAKDAGRLTLNPIAHIDVMGMIVVPILLILTIGIPFGWAKPVPINPFMLKNPKKNMIFIAIAGPASNFVMAFIGITILKSGYIANYASIKMLLTYFIFLNLALTCLNVIPIPPLDGARIVSGFLPRKQAIAFSKIEPYGIFIVGTLIYLGFAGKWIRAGIEILLKFSGINGMDGLM